MSFHTHLTGEYGAGNVAIPELMTPSYSEKKPKERRTYRESMEIKGIKACINKLSNNKVHSYAWADVVGENGKLQEEKCIFKLCLIIFFCLPQLCFVFHLWQTKVVICVHKFVIITKTNMIFTPCLTLSQVSVLLWFQEASFLSSINFDMHQSLLLLSKKTHRVRVVILYNGNTKKANSMIDSSW